MVKPLVDYPDDDDEDAMDTKPEALPQQVAQGEPSVADIQVEPSPEVIATPTSPSVQTPAAPERLAEKRRREEEDEDELVKLATGPKRRSSINSNSSTGSLNRKKAMSIGSMEKGGAALGGVTGGAAPKRIAINLGPTVKSSTPDNESNEKENRDDSQGDEGG